MFHRPLLSIWIIGLQDVRAETMLIRKELTNSVSFTQRKLILNVLVGEESSDGQAGESLPTIQFDRIFVVHT